MKNLWKGIAIAGIWISAASVTACLAWTVTSNKGQQIETTPIWIAAFIISWAIKNRDE